MRRNASRLLSPVLLSFCLAPLAAGTSTPGAQQTAPVYRTTARAVVVDVVVTKGNDEPVPGLHKQDFQVMEDGKSVTIDYFEEHTAKTLAPGALPEPVKMPPNVYTNVPPAPESDAVNVLLLDSLNTRKQDQIFVHKQILDFLKGMQPGTRVAIFLLGSKLRFVQGFTADSSVLLAALNDQANSLAPQRDSSARSRDENQEDNEHIARMIAMNNGHSAGGIDAIASSQRDYADFQYGDRAAMTLEALDYLARYLGGVPGRKNLIWFASAFPVTVFPTPSQRQAMSDMRVYSSALKRTADLLTVSKVAVYPVSAEGVMEEHILEANEAAPSDNENLGGGGGSARAGGAMTPYMGGSAARADRISAMEQLAADTGGKAFYNTNDLNAAMANAINDGAHYYTLVYTPINKKMDGSYRRIEVKLSAGRYKLAYRRGYNADDTLAAAESRPETDPLRPLLTRGLPSATQLLYGVRVLPVVPQPASNATRAGKNPKLTGPFTRYSVDFMIRLSDVRLELAADGTHTGKIQVGLMAYDRDGNPVNWVGATEGMSLKPDIYAAIQKSGVPAHMEIDLPNTDVFLETGVYDWGTGKAGTLEIPLNSATSTIAQSSSENH
jgi:VWFA-related protein